MMKKYLKLTFHYRTLIVINFGQTKIEKTTELSMVFVIFILIEA